MEAYTVNGSLTVEADPKNSDNKCFEFHAGGGDEIRIAAQTDKIVNSLVLEFKIMFDKNAAQNIGGFQIHLMTSNSKAYIFTINLAGDGTFTVGDLSATSSAIENVFSGKFNAYEWNTIRVEHYLIDAASHQTITKIFVNNELPFTSNNYCGKEKDNAPDMRYRTLRIVALSEARFVAYLDDIKAYQSSASYSEDTFD